MAIATMLVYLEKMGIALKSPGAHNFYFPREIERRRVANLRLGREIGYGMGAWSAKERTPCVSALYGRYVVANSLDNTGVAIDARDWVVAINEGITQYNHNATYNFEPIETEEQGEP